MHEAELFALTKALEDVLPKMGNDDKLELYCDREVVVKQLNHQAGIRDKSVLRMTDKIWNLAYKVKEESKIEVKFLWVSRKKNPAGKMLGV